mgnify:CR=1 FL=1
MPRKSTAPSVLGGPASGIATVISSVPSDSADDAAAGGDDQAELALSVAAYRLQKYIGGYHVAVGGAQAIVFTAGIGENSWPFRERVVDGLGALGVELDRMANVDRGGGARVISTAGSAIPVLVVATDEEAAIAQATADVVRSSGA